MLDPSNIFQNKGRLISRRMFVLSLVQITVFISIVSRLFYLQISENIKYRSLSDKNRLREWKISPSRGIITDFFGKKIAENKQVYQLHMMPEDVENIENLLFKLSRVINFDERRRRQLLKKLKKRKAWETIIVAENLSWAEFSRLNIFAHEMRGVKPVVSIDRKYFDDGSTSHIIGYVSYTSKKDLENNELLREINIPGLKTGKNGLEKHLNNQMIGKPGIQRFEVNAFGKKIKELELIKGVSGKNFRTTLDHDVQKYANELLVGRSGSICVMDIYTGDIITLISSPTFDPNKFVYGIDNEDWQNLIKDKKKPLINKSMAGLYPPGSTIKPIVALSALENDVISPKLTVECKGSVERYDRVYHCWKKKGHGFMNLRNAIKQSCDIYFYEVARRLGIDRLADTAKEYGLGKKVLETFEEEKSGVVPNTKWKLEKIGKSWYLGETFISGIGQGYFQTTPLQLCLMTAQLANGGYEIKPRIIDDRYTLQSTVNAWRTEFELRRSESKSDNPYLKKLYRNKENVKFVLDAMYRATNEPMGTSFRSRFVKPEYIYAGKTGTSQIRTITEEERELDLKTHQIPYEKRDHALFIAFAPYKKPRYAFSIVIEHGGSGSSGAAPLAKKLIKKVLDRHKLRSKLQLDLFDEV
tara:strand:- start:4820 stop:6745 length:1926 start_codon:yes stop_codon:yes gene_type:complete